jgi:hypothetical protein
MTHLVDLDRAMPRARLTAGDQPVDTAEVKVWTGPGAAQHRQPNGRRSVSPAEFADPFGLEPQDWIEPLPIRGFPDGLAA